MTDEIKEKIYNLRKYLGTEENWILNGIQDYITNLQEELEITKKKQEEDKTFFENRLKENVKLRKRIEKAIEYIMTELIDEWNIKNGGYVSGSDLPVDTIIPLLDILKGDEDE